MEFKHLLYCTAVISSLGQIVLALYSRYIGDIAQLIESAQIPEGLNQAVIDALNYVLPVGVGCVALLFYTRKVNKVGGVALLMVLGLQLAALQVNLRAAKHAFGEQTTLAAMTWWAPK
jgi:hypothetical protein